MENNQHLPDELILLILLRLPIKSLMRFKCVSKSWLSLISHPNFGKSHFELSAAPTPKLIYLEPSLSEARTLDVNASLHHDSVVSKFTFPLMLPLDDFSIRGSCRGFILLEDYPFMFLWNPSTGEIQSVFYSGISSGWYASSFLYGFGYDALIDDYLVVIASVGVKSEANIRHIRLEFYSLRTISWKEIAVTHFPYTCRGDQSGLLFNGAIHWVVFRDTDYEDETEGVIIAFDLIERNISEVVPVPSHVYDYSYLYDLRVIDGCLALCYGSFRGEPSEVWVMQEYKVESSWIHFEVFEFPTSRFFPICLTEGGEVVGLDESKDLVKLIVEGDVGKLLEHGAHCHRGEIVMYAESLLSLPPIDGEEAEGDDQQKELGP